MVQEKIKLFQNKYKELKREVEKYNQGVQIFD